MQRTLKPLLAVPGTEENPYPDEAASAGEGDEGAEQEEGEQSDEEDDEICAPEQDASDDAAAEAANRALGYGK